ncbi:hypothetical protein EDB74_108216 [Vibrio crassostreae]|uniref:hypothetical protein n=1 Tax=Vibrio crassostreae TaxID=246167 RepID=UPI0010469C89|nr:hypothetical protein [Vibrio crassostreae]TCT44219.1 hypothetical protein EDB29_1011030 [Vibrio crassostreae]TCV60669.1 hypothetical protein EDB74_108216 [Vibrio crassostreae]
MAREISFKSNGPQWNVVLSMTITYTIVSLMISFFYQTELQLFPFITSITLMTLVYMFASRLKKSHLSLDDGNVYLHGIKANLVVRKSLFGHSFIEVKPLTEKGYHKVTIRKGQVELSDWELLLSKTTQSR